MRQRCSLSAGVTVALLGCCIVGGCDAPPRGRVSNASPGEQSTVGIEEHIAPALSAAPEIDALRRRAAQQRSVSGAASGLAGLPPPWEPDARPLEGEALERAKRTLDSVLDEIRARPAFSEPVEQVTVPDDDRVQALRLYARARQALAAQDHETALTLLENASKLDPMAGEVWQMLGQAQFTSGLRSTAITSLERAARLGIDDPRIWSMLGLEALRRRNSADAARWLTAALDGVDPQVDATSLAWLEVSLGELLGDEGYLAASAELLETALGLVSKAAASEDQRSEYATLIRRRPQLWMRVGDARAWLGDWSSAASAYDRAGVELSDDQELEVEERRIAALTRMHHSAEAALVLLESLKRRNGLAGDAQLAVAREIAADEPLFAGALRVLPEQFVSPTPAARARFAVLLLATSTDLSLEQRLNLLAPDWPLLARHVVELLTPLPSADARWQAARALATRRPDDVSIIADALYAAPLLSADELMVRSQDADVLSASVRLRMQTPVRTLDLDRLAAQPGGLPIAIMTAVATGRWDRVDSLLAAGAESPAPVRWRAQAAGLDPVSALATWDAWRQDHIPTATQLIEAARIAASAGEAARSVDLLSEATQADPYLEQAYGLLIGSLLSAGIDPGSSNVQAALQQLRTHLPECATLQALAVMELRRQGFVQEMIEGTQRLIERMPAPSEDDYEALIGPWEIARQRGDESLLDQSQQWLSARIDPQRPEPAATLTLARLLALRGRSEEALALLDNPAIQGPTAVARQRESLLRDLDRRAEADASALARLDSPRLSIVEVLELAQIRLARREPMEDVLERLSAVPTRVRLSSDAMSAVLSLCSQLQGAILAADDEEARRRFAGNFVRAAGFGIDRGLPMREPVHRLRLRYAAEQPETGYDELVGITDQYAAAIGRIGDEAFGETFNLLIESGRTQEALRLAVHIVSGSEELDAQRWLQVVPRLASLGTIQTVEQVMDRLESRSQLEAAVRAFGLDEAHVEDAGVDPRAEFCYVLAGLASANDRRAQSVLLYQRALAYQPDHPWACNDYGYLLAEEGVELDEAERLLEIAYAKLPDRASILDSIGWLRYKQGRFLDDAQTPGALSLLTRAVGSPDGALNPTIQHHLGDTLWMCGDEAGAREAWLTAERLYLNRVRTFTTPEQRRLPQYTATQQSLREVRDKLAALEIEGQEPKVAPTKGTRLKPGT